MARCFRRLELLGPAFERLEHSRAQQPIDVAAGTTDRAASHGSSIVPSVRVKLAPCVSDVPRPSRRARCWRSWQRLPRSGATARSSIGVCGANRSHFQGPRLRAPRFGPARWMPDGKAYAIVERNNGGSEIDTYDAVTGAKAVLVSAARLMPPGATAPTRHRRLPVVGGRPAAADLHQHQKSVASEHARRLLGARRRNRAR